MDYWQKGWLKSAMGRSKPGLSFQLWMLALLFMPCYTLFATKQPNLKLKTWPKQLLGSLQLAFILPILSQLKPLDECYKICVKMPANGAKSATRFCHQVAGWVPDLLRNFYFVKNHKNNSTTTNAREKISAY